MDHIGINVPEIDFATKFLQEAFGAEVIYESYSKQQPPLNLSGIESTLNVAQGTKIYACRMIKIGYEPIIELFEIHVDGQRNAIMSSDLGLQHLSLYTDDIFQSIQQFELAGGKMLSAPNPILFLMEKGNLNYFCYLPLGNFNRIYYVSGGDAV
ncbi:catechol 2,3-dioxygenase-like lactoylglutathione lyase family enzyme [Mucilaginibacter sp. UYP25]|uniref:VOC family protein n=1 Tax=unclassified Mucilaginibacter TaxID=2617802 RepID=UPI003391F37B